MKTFISKASSPSCLSFSMHLLVSFFKGYFCRSKKIRENVRFEIVHIFVPSGLQEKDFFEDQNDEDLNGQARIPW